MVTLLLRVHKQYDIYVEHCKEKEKEKEILSQLRILQTRLKVKTMKRFYFEMVRILIST